MKKLLLLLFIPFVCFGQEEIDFGSKEGIIKFFDSKSSIDVLEGVWGTKKSTVVISENDNKYYLIYSSVSGLEFKDINYFCNVFYSEKNWSNSKTGDTIGIYKVNYVNNKLKLTTDNIRKPERVEDEIIAIEDLPFVNECTNIKVLTIDFKSNKLRSSSFFPHNKVYPDQSFSQKISVQIMKDLGFKPTNWKGNGSGVIISDAGYIVTNNHVIEGSDFIEVEFKVGEISQNVNAEVVQKDLRNDLAILKIVDVNFDGFGKVNYNFKTRSSDVGTKIYTFGYPKALSGMGKDIKVTEGIISSKSGIMGDITTYQITAPIQGGNSAGPLFDDKGNLVGINSSRFNSDETENVNYSIKSSYVFNLIDALSKSIDLPSSTKLQSLPLTEQIKEISKYVVLIKVK